MIKKYNNYTTHYTTQHSSISNPFGFENLFEHDILGYYIQMFIKNSVFRILHFWQPCLKIIQIDFIATRGTF